MSSGKSLGSPRDKGKEGNSKIVILYPAEHQSQSHIGEDYLNKFVLIHFSRWGDICVTLIVVARLSYHNALNNISKSS